MVQGRGCFEKIILTANDKVEGKKRKSHRSQQVCNLSAVRMSKLGSTVCNVSLSLFVGDRRNVKEEKRAEFLGKEAPMAAPREQGSE